jgi:hypothetical protein
MVARFQMNNINPDMLWTVINLLWSAILILASVWLFSISRHLERERRRYLHFIKRQ